MTSSTGGGSPSRAASGHSKTSAAEKLARALAAKFLEEGNYTATLSGFGKAAAGMSPSSLPHSAEFEAAFSESGFSGLAVQAVGFADSGEEAVYVYVAKGKAKSVSGDEFDDSEIPIRIRRIGKLAIKPEMASGATNKGHLFQRNNRIACGSSCAPSAEDYSGTFGAIVRLKGDQDLHILSNNHVIAACNHTPVGQPILAPSNMDSFAGRPAPVEIARHAGICELRSGVPSLVNPCNEDVAVAKVTDPKRISSWQGLVDGYDTPTKATNPVPGMRVVKWGRTTGRTVGIVESLIPTDTPIPYKTRYFTATVWFRSVWAIASADKTPFVLPGDSGSLVATEDGKLAVGLVFASGMGYGLIIPIPHILSCMGGLELVGNHGV